MITLRHTPNLCAGPPPRPLTPEGRPTHRGGPPLGP
jgi:hypothetical protein